MRNKPCSVRGVLSVLAWRDERRQTERTSRGHPVSLVHAHSVGEVPRDTPASVVMSGPSARLHVSPLVTLAGRGKKRLLYCQLNYTTSAFLGEISIEVVEADICEVDMTLCMLHRAERPPTT